MNVETDNDIEDIEQNVVCLFIFAMSMSYIVEKLNHSCKCFIKFNSHFNVFWTLSKTGLGDDKGRIILINGYPGSGMKI